MSPDSNLKSIELLNHNPRQLILSLQDMIHLIVYQFTRTGKLSYHEQKDIRQHVNEELLKKIPVIQKQFQGKSLLRTYLATIVTNICHEMVRKKKKIDFTPLTENNTLTSRNEAIDYLIIQDEVRTLRKVLNLYYKQKPKLILLLKLKFRIPLYFDDLKNVVPDINFSEFEQFIFRISPYENSTDIKIFTALTGIFNTYGNKNNTPDALRKWIKQKIDELIDILNGDPPVSGYTEETLQILFENCFEQERKAIVNIAL